MKIIAINASPRKNWNTAQLVRAAAEGAEVEIIDLYTIGKYSGCISCFGCKTEKHYGECICNDDLKPVLDKIRAADGLKAELVTEGEAYEHYKKLTEDTFKGAMQLKCAVIITPEKLINASPNEHNKEEIEI